MTPYQKAMELANSVPLWGFCSLIIGLVFIQTAVFVWISGRYAERANVTALDIKRSMRAGLISTLGPALSVFVVGLGLITQIGTPLTLARLSVIGNATYEASSAEMASVAMGTSLGSETYSMQAFAASVWVMNLGGVCMVLPTLLFLKSLSRITRAADKRMAGGMILGASASLASFGYFAADYARRDRQNLIAVLAGFFSMVGINCAAKHWKAAWLKEWALAFSILSVLVAVGVSGGS